MLLAGFRQLPSRQCQRLKTDPIFTYPVIKAQYSRSSSMESLDSSTERGHRPRNAISAWENFLRRLFTRAEFANGVNTNQPFVSIACEFVRSFVRSFENQSCEYDSRRDLVPIAAHLRRRRANIPCPRNTTVRLQMATKKWEALICPFCPSRLRFRVVGSYVEPCKSYQYATSQSTPRILVSLWNRTKIFSSDTKRSCMPPNENGLRTSSGAQILIVTTGKPMTSVAWGMRWCVKRAVFKPVLSIKCPGTITDRLVRNLEPKPTHTI